MKSSYKYKSLDNILGSRKNKTLNGNIIDFDYPIQFTSKINNEKTQFINRTFIIKKHVHHQKKGLNKNRSVIVNKENIQEGLKKYIKRHDEDYKKLDLFLKICKNNFRNKYKEKLTLDKKYSNLYNLCSLKKINTSSNKYWSSKSEIIPLNKIYSLGKKFNNNKLNNIYKSCNNSSKANKNNTFKNNIESYLYKRVDDPPQVGNYIESNKINLIKNNYQNQRNDQGLESPFQINTLSLNNKNKDETIKKDNSYNGFVIDEGKNTRHYKKIKISKNLASVIE